MHRHVVVRCISRAVVALMVVCAGALGLPAAAAAHGAHTAEGAADAMRTWSARPRAQHPANPLNDLFALGQAGGQTPAPAPVQRHPEPPLVATPRADCAPGSSTEPGIQGRVPAGAADRGLICNLSLVSHQGHSGGFKVLRYIDTHGRECAYYDTALLFPLNALRFDGTSLGVAVVDMSDPSHPVQTDTLTQPPMMSPHESLALNPRRGLLAAVLGNPATHPGLVSIYDAHEDCRYPVLQSTSPVSRFGHESAFAPDGRTFYSAGTAVHSVTAIDVTNPKTPHAVWHGNLLSHGMTISPEGRRAYIADPAARNMLILDTSEIQARIPNPQAREISRLAWRPASIPQNVIPFTSRGKQYALEIDEYTEGTLNPQGSDHAVGAARIVDISDERRPHVVSNLRLQVNQPADHEAASDDPGGGNPAQGYVAHYCNIPTRVDPKIAACSFVASGLRVFDISDVRAPKEIAYFVAPPKPRIETGYTGSNFAMSQPTFAPERREIWYSDGGTGFYALRLNRAAAQSETAGGAPGPPSGQAAGSNDNDPDSPPGDSAAAAGASTESGEGDRLPFTGLGLALLIVAGATLLSAGILLRSWPGRGRILR